MNDSKVYWYEVHMVVGSAVFQKYLFKSDHLYEVGDILRKRYDSGAVVKLIIVYSFGDTFPAQIFREMSDRFLWPPILSEI